MDLTDNEKRDAVKLIEAGKLLGSSLFCVGGYNSM